MAAHNDATPDSPQQQEQDAYLAACTALLVAIATNTLLTDDEVDTLAGMFADLAPVTSRDINLSASLRCNLGLLGLTKRGAMEWLG